MLVLLLMIVCLLDPLAKVLDRPGPETDSEAAGRWLPQLSVPVCSAKFKFLPGCGGAATGLRLGVTGSATVALAA